MAGPDRRQPARAPLGERRARGGRIDPTPDVLARLEIASRLAREAGEIVVRRYGETGRRLKAGGSPVTQADLEANERIVAGLREAFPEDGVRAEESPGPAGGSGSRLWVVDPLDGTKEFLAGNGEFAVMIGLAESGRAVLGVVLLPVPDLLYRAVIGGGAWVERGDRVERLRCAQLRKDVLRFIGSRSHPDALVTRMKFELGVTDEEQAGSVGVKCARIAEGTRDLYVHPVGHLKEWDTCAPEVIVREAGGTVKDCEGAPLRYGKREPSQPHGMLACGAGDATGLIDRVSGIYRAARNES
jgi:3'(2'), 5'-bisphosphate nucleotidase